ncbi:hypothetical protein SNE40_023191 [Patella caerulea]|uniref:Uncharacterized protein n=1 Tax=Patella caerulea TaxID=87958 RepID=A0AAN8GBU4_PATCE
MENVNSNNQTPVNHNGHIYSHPFDKATVLNSNFTSVSKLDKSRELLPFDARSGITMDDFIVTEQEVKDQLKILDSSKPPGPDAISPLIPKKHISRHRNSSI